ncbi:hypothetical protein B4U80_11654 [Leptotrombidium deliense]|uniref:Uncharacterized protein n=1 Tax=Leptotrombidium deliense TaxID=299467 RepID=A0A443ST37_9ACAR|nr:hypothetical protein B4U80_11654 [Leptotrombidium deliense]
MLEVNVDEETRLKAEQRYKELKSSGTCTPGTSPHVKMNEKPVWFNETKFKEAQNVCQKYFVRYESDPYKTRSKANVSVKYVRLMHKQLYSRMNVNTNEEKKKESPIWVSQYDMVLTQWSIVAPFLLFPQKCGMHNVTKQEMQQFIYFWKVMGRILGIEDEYNCCSGTYEECHRYNQLILENDYKPVMMNLKYPSSIGFESAKGLSIGIQPLAPILSMQGLMRYWYKFLGIPHYIPVEDRFGYKSVVYFIETLLNSTNMETKNNQKISREKIF